MNNGRIAQMYLYSIDHSVRMAEGLLVVSARTMLLTRVKVGEKVGVKGRCAAWWAARSSKAPMLRGRKYMYGMRGSHDLNLPISGSGLILNNWPHGVGRTDCG